MKDRQPRARDTRNLEDVQRCKAVPMRPPEPGEFATDDRCRVDG